MTYLSPLILFLVSRLSANDFLSVDSLKDLPKLSPFSGNIYRQAPDCEPFEPDSGAFGWNFGWGAPCVERVWSSEIRGYYRQFPDLLKKYELH